MCHTHTRVNAYIYLTFKYRLSRKAQLFLLLFSSYYSQSLFFFFAYLISSIIIWRAANHNSLAQRITDFVKLNLFARVCDTLIQISRINRILRWWYKHISIIWKVNRPSNKLPCSRILRNDIQRNVKTLSYCYATWSFLSSYTPLEIRERRPMLIHLRLLIVRRSKSAIEDVGGRVIFVAEKFKPLTVIARDLFTNGAL